MNGGCRFESARVVMVNGHGVRWFERLRVLESIFSFLVVVLPLSSSIPAFDLA